MPVVLPAPKILMIGPQGTGKTYSANMLARHDIECFNLFTEQGADTLTSDSFPPDVRAMLGKSIHTHFVPPGDNTFDEMIKQAENISIMSFQQICEAPAVNRKKENEFVKILRALNNYKCEITGKEYGAVDSWGPDKALILDGLSGLNEAVMRAVRGTKPTASPGEWGIGMNQEEMLISKLTNACKCWVIIISHPEREKNELTGGTKIYPAMLGTKLGPKIGRLFGEVIETKRIGSQYFWSTMSDTVDTKNRSLPLGDKITPDWKPIVEGFRRMQQAQAQAVGAATAA